MSDQDVDYKINSNLEIIYKLRNEEVGTVYTGLIKTHEERYIFSGGRIVVRQFRNFSLVIRYAQDYSYIYDPSTRAKNRRHDEDW